MYLADLLAYADIHHLNRIARQYECECSHHSKNDLIQSILSAMHRRDVLEKAVQSMSLEEMRFLNAILFDKRNAFSLEELTVWAKQTRFPQEAQGAGGGEEISPRDTIAKFQRLGWLFNGHSPQTKYLITVPEDIKRKICDSLARRFRERLIRTDAPEVYRDEHDFLLGDILNFLDFVHRHEVLLTSDGYMYKRQLHQLLQSLQVAEQPVARGGWRFGYGRRFKEYPDRFSLIYDYCYYHQYIAEEEHALRLTERGEEALARGRKESPLDVYRFWIRLYKGPVRNIQAIVQWICILADEWVSAASLGEVLCPLIRPYYYDSADSILNQRILAMMMHQGLLRMGQHGEYGAVVQVTRRGAEVVKGTYVEENDRIDLPPEQS
jgi:hypothetical protein